MSDNIFPMFLRVEHKPGNAAQSLLAEINAALTPAERRFAQFSDEAKRQLDQAMSLGATKSGSLNLGVEELKRAAAAQELRALAAREVARATAAAAAREGDYSEKARLATAASQALAREEEDAARAARSHAVAVEQVQRELDQAAKSSTALAIQYGRGAAASRAFLGATSANRVAFTQLGQQMQDATIQAQMGTSAFTIFAQQMPQAAFALSGLTGAAGSAAARVGAFATFLSGPWGAAIFAATAVLGPMIYNLFELGDAADEALSKLDTALQRFREGLTQTDALGEVFTQATRDRIDLLVEEARLRRQISTYDTAIATPGIDPRGMEAINRQRANAQSRLAEIRGEVESIDNRIRGAIADQQTANRLQAEQAAREEARDGRGGRASRLTEEARASNQAREATARYIESLSSEIAQIGLSRAQLRELEVSRQMAAASTDREREAIQRLGLAREEALAREDQRQVAAEVDSMITQSQRGLDIERLRLAGRDDEAEVLRIMLDLEDKRGLLAWEHLDAVKQMVAAEREQTEELQRRQALQNAYLDTTRAIRGELESVFAGGDANFGKIARQLQSRVMVESLFGDAFRQLDREVRSGFDDQVDYLEANFRRAQESAAQLAQTFTEVARAAANPAYRPNLPAGVALANDNAAGKLDPDAIYVTAPGTLAGMDPQEYFAKTGKALAAPIVDAIETQIGVRLPAELQGVLSGAISGYLGAGPVGGAIGALQGLLGPSAGLSAMFGGAQTGNTVNGLLGMLGINGSGTGAALGGAIGSALPIPGGAIVGSLAGSMIGKLGLGDRQLAGILGGPITYGLMHALGIGGAKWGTASFNGSGDFSVAGSGATRQAGATDMGDAFMDALNSILDQLDASLGDFAVSIATYKDKFLVSSTGASGKLKPGQSGVTVYEDAAAAQAAAIMNAIADGALRGLSAAEQRLATQDKELEAALQDVLDFRSVFERLKAYKDPVGAALDELNNEFADLIDLFQRAGASTAEFTALEELYGIERARAIQEASDSLTSSLRQLLDDLNMGDNGLSLRERQGNALAEYNALRARVQAGDTTAFEGFSAAAQTVLDLTRQIEGSQSGYFNLFDQVRSVTSAALNQQDRLTQEAINRDTPFTAADTALISTIDRNGTEQVNQLVAVNNQLVAVNNNLAIQNQLLAANGTYAANYRLAAYSGFANNF